MMMVIPLLSAAPVQPPPVVYLSVTATACRVSLSLSFYVTPLFIIKVLLIPGFCVPTFPVSLHLIILLLLPAVGETLDGISMYVFDGQLERREGLFIFPFWGPSLSVVLGGWQAGRTGG